MKYENLKDLIQNSSSSRKYFLSLSPSMQVKLHEHNDYIHSAEDLHVKKLQIERTKFF